MHSLSIITANLNNAPGLTLTIRSIVSQTFRSIELIVIDGGSTDESLNVIGQFQNSITRWVSEPDDGIFNAQNKGIKIATGEYCLFLNSGDYLADNRVVEKIFAAKNDVDIIYGDLLLARKAGKPELRKSPVRIGKLKMLKDTLWHPVSFIRRNLFLNYGMYDERFKIVGDYEFFVRTLIKYKVKYQYIPISVSVFDTTGVSSNMRFRKQLEEERRRVQDIYINKIILFFFRLYSKLRN